MIFSNAVQTRFFRACRSPYLFTALTAFYLAGWVFATGRTREFSGDSLKVFLAFSLVFCILSYVKKQNRAVWVGPLVLMCVLYPASVYLAGWAQGAALPPEEAKLYRLPLFFIWLPFFVWGSRFDLGRLGAILYGIMLLILLWTAYTLAYLGMKRMDVDAVMGAVIIYDGMLLILVLLGWVHALAQYGQGRKTAGWLWTAVACAAVSVVVLHGSRGAWLGIPLVLLYLYGAYRKRSLPLWRLAAVWLTVFFVWLGVSPHSPLQQRVAAAGQEVAAGLARFPKCAAGGCGCNGSAGNPLPGS